MRFLRKHPIWSLFILVLAVLLVWTLWGNTALMTTEYCIQSTKVPASFDGFRIAQVSDLHNEEFGSGNQKLLTMLNNAQPDLIAITGDMLDSRKTDPEIAIGFAEEAVKIAPVYYIPGNHESRLTDVYQQLKAALTELGVVVLENESIPLQQGADVITLTGLLDPDFGISWPEFSADNYHIVLSHRPELLHLYAEKGFDLVFSGHAHGGQFRLPFIGGFFAPHQGFLPMYTSGVHTHGNTSMVVSRGLGNSIFPLRFNNRPELIIVTLESL